MEHGLHFTGPDRGIIHKGTVVAAYRAVSSADAAAKPIGSAKQKSLMLQGVTPHSDEVALLVLPDMGNIRQIVGDRQKFLLDQ